MRTSIASAAIACGLAACVPAAPTLDPTATSVVSTAAPSPTIPAAPTPPPTPVCTSEHGTWESFTYRGVAVAGEVAARVYLPPCYAETGELYPTAYFFHGKPYTEEQWIDLGLEGLLSASATGREAFSAIVVLARVPEPLFSGSDGGPGSYEQEFRDGLMAAIDSALPTLPSASGRALVGISRGGVWALEIGLRNPQDVGAVAALSPALAVNYARPAYDPLQLAAAAPLLPERVYLAAGEDDWARSSTQDLGSLLDGRGASPVVRVVPGVHSDETWRALLPEVIEFLRAYLIQGGSGRSGGAGIAGTMDSQGQRQP